MVFISSLKKTKVLCNSTTLRVIISYKSNMLVGSSKRLSKCYSNDQLIECQSVTLNRTKQTFFVWNYPLYIKFKNKRKKKVRHNLLLL